MASITDHDERARSGPRDASLTVTSRSPQGTARPHGEASILRGRLAGWCNGSTKRSGRFSLGSNPSPAVEKAPQLAGFSRPGGRMGRPAGMSRPAIGSRRARRLDVERQPWSRPSPSSAARLSDSRSSCSCSVLLSRRAPTAAVASGMPRRDTRLHGRTGFGPETSVVGKPAGWFGVGCGLRARASSRTSEVGGSPPETVGSRGGAPRGGP